MGDGHPDGEAVAAQRPGAVQGLAAQGIDALKAQLNDAGMPDIIAEVEAQYAEWKAAQ